MFFKKFVEEDLINDFEKNLENITNKSDKLNEIKFQGAIELLNHAAALLDKVKFTKEANLSRQIIKKINLEKNPQIKTASRFIRANENRLEGEVIIDDETFPFDESEAFELGKMLGMKDFRFKDQEELPDILYQALINDVELQDLAEFAKGYAFGAKLDDKTMQAQFKKIFQFLEGKIDNNFVDDKCAYCNDMQSVEDTGFCSKDCEDAAFLDDLLKYSKNDPDMHDAKCVGTESSPVGSPRQRSFCKRMCGHKKKNTNSETANDPDSCINQALRRWKCRCQ